jgi:hypothetical protein
MPPLAVALRVRVAEAIKLAEVGEVARAEAAPASQTRRNLHPTRLEALYEMAYLRIFVGWEAFLEEVFLRYLCGYVSVHGCAPLMPGVTYEPTLARAEQAILAGYRFVLWHDPVKVGARARRFFHASRIETVVLSNTARLQDLAAIRHRITHAQEDARRNFDQATMAIAGRRYRGARPGAFLRDVDAGAVPPNRWLERLGKEFEGLAQQIA